MRISDWSSDVCSSDLWRGKITQETRYFIASTTLTPERAAEAIRGHWGIESLHWVLDVIFKEDQSRLSRGHGAHNIALVRRLDFNPVRPGRAQRHIKTARTTPGRTPEFPASTILPPPP